MLVQGTQGDEASGTFAACEGPLPRVCSLVDFQLRPRPKEPLALGALKAFKWRRFLVTLGRCAVSPGVVVQLCLRGKHLATEGTRQRKRLLPRTGSVSQVPHEVVFATEGLLADRAQELLGYFAAVLRGGVTEVLSKVGNITFVSCLLYGGGMSTLARHEVCRQRGRWCPAYSRAFLFASCELV